MIENLIGLLRDQIDKGGVLRVANKTITSAQLLALNATPQTLVNAPGANLVLVPELAVFYKPAGTAYAGIAAGEDLSVKWTDGSGTELMGCETTGFLNQTTAQTRIARSYNAASLVSDFTPTANAALVLHLLVGEITTGDSDLLVRLYYRIMPTILGV